jgi:hypothetical protein
MLLKKYVLLPILDALKTFKEENLYEFNKKIFVLINVQLNFYFRSLKRRHDHLNTGDNSKKTKFSFLDLDVLDGNDT